eukprot:TRINITY_DN621_c0_g1_i1.p1 TRINITY_DN621_c0_g1~~TRINITY_DN621_c0_g1_i1.p1  ORF type:complete len:308 (+),score=52.72 TRINITY_DN621_c0_g1_i1:67-990(+)
MSETLPSTNNNQAFMAKNSWLTRLESTSKSELRQSILSHHMGDGRRFFRVSGKPLKNVLFVGLPHVGKSSLINTMASEIEQWSDYIEPQQVGESGAIGTYAVVQEPYCILNQNGEELVRLFDCAGFRGENDCDEYLEKICEMVLGHVRIGESIAKDAPAIVSSSSTKEQMDLVVLVANYQNQDSVDQILKLKAGLDRNGIHSFLVFTHAGESKQLTGIKAHHFCVESRTRENQIAEDDCRILFLLASIIRELEMMKRGENNPSWIYLIQKFFALIRKNAKKYAPEQWRYYLVVFMALILGIVLARLL